MSTKIADESADIDTVVRDIDLLKKDIAKLMERMAVDAKDSVNGEARRLYGAMSAEGERTAAAIAQQVEERPFASLLVAFAVGYLSSRVLTR